MAPSLLKGEQDSKYLRIQRMRIARANKPIRPQSEKLGINNGQLPQTRSERLAFRMNETKRPVFGR